MTPTDLQNELHKRGLSIRRAAPILGLHPVTVAKYKSGAKPINRDRADLIRMRLADYDYGHERTPTTTQSDD